jgi:hypothetical protein
MPGRSNAPWRTNRQTSRADEPAFRELSAHPDK